MKKKICIFTIILCVFLLSSYVLYQYLTDVLVKKTLTVMHEDVYVREELEKALDKVTSSSQGNIASDDAIVNNKTDNAQTDVFNEIEIDESDSPQDLHDNVFSKQVDYIVSRYRGGLSGRKMGDENRESANQNEIHADFSDENLDIKSPYYAVHKIINNATEISSSEKNVQNKSAKANQAKEDQNTADIEKNVNANDATQKDSSVSKHAGSLTIDDLNKSDKEYVLSIYRRFSASEVSTCSAMLADGLTTEEKRTIKSIVYAKISQAEMNTLLSIANKYY